MEKRNKHTKKNFAPTWLYLQDYTRMHGQQNIKCCTNLALFTRLYKDARSTEHKIWKCKYLRHCASRVVDTVQFCKAIKITVYKSLFLWLDDPVAGQGLANHYTNGFVKFIPSWCIILHLAHVLRSTATNFILVNTCRMLLPYRPSPSILKYGYYQLKK